MFEEMTFSERLKRNLKLNSWGILKPSIEIGILLKEEKNGKNTRNLQDCCFKFIELKMENKITDEIKARIEKLKERIRERIEFLTNDLKDDEDQFNEEGIYRESLNALRAKYYEILSWKSALEVLSDKEFKPFNARKHIQTKIDDAKKWNDFLKDIGVNNLTR